MITNTTANTEINNALGLQRIGARIIRYGLVAVLLWVGMLKFTAYEAELVLVYIKPAEGLSFSRPFLQENIMVDNKIT